jgi:hypothetical protein
MRGTLGGVRKEIPIRQGSMNMAKVPDAAKLTRANYMKMLDSWQQ